VRVENPLDFDVVLPTDVVGASEFAADAESAVYPFDGLPDGWLGLDIGPESRERFAEVITDAGTIFWNGPMGVFETKPFDAGTLGVAKILAASSGFTVVGGGESVEAVVEAGLAGSISHVSTGGGASLDLVAGETLPGVEALR
jgi:phosphoglycerate kinase